MSEFTSYFDEIKKFLEQSKTNDLKTKHFLESIADVDVKISFGQGTPARIPWISFLIKPNTTSNGIYPAYLLYKDKNLLILSYCISEMNIPEINWKIKNGKTISEYFQENSLGIPERYGNSYVYKVYDVNSLPDRYIIDQNLLSIINEYKLINKNNTITSKPLGSINIASKFQNDLKVSGLKFSGKLITRFIASLLSKRFVILTGLSGSGKTKLAQVFAQWICKSDVQTSSDNIIEINLPLNKSAIEHRGWTLPKNFKKNLGESNKIPVEIEIAGKKVSAFIETLHRLFYDKQLTLTTDDSNSEVPVKIEFINQTFSNNSFSRQYCIVPVGADWTNREPLLGYPNALKPAEYVKPDNEALELIINANKNPELPFFLILDEMNLSHVERYFADFLSVMESNDKIQLHSGIIDNGVPNKISLPDNLFIIGTVNIDETTYMFSPKVLDRANTIEFKVNQEEMKDFIDNVSNIDINELIGKGVSLANGFLELTRKNIDNKIESELKTSLMNFFGQLKKVGAEFGYRSATEMINLIAKLSLVDPNLSDYEKLDIAIMQKLLPKLHGSRRKLCPILIKIGSFCVNENIHNVEKQVFEKDEFDFNSSDVKFPLSLEKISRMYRGAIDNGFASYAEA